MHLSPSQKSLESFDISYVDPQTQTYIFADRSNGGISVWDAESKTFLLNTGQFAGAATSGHDTCTASQSSGPNGVLIIDQRRDDDRHYDPDQWQGREGHDNDRDDLQAWGGDGDSTVKVVRVSDGNPIATIQTGPAKMCRADEMANDPRDHILAVANDAAPGGPFLTFIKTTGHLGNSSVVGQLVYDNGIGPCPASPPVCHHAQQANGMEQTIYDPHSGHFWLALPSTTANSANGEIDEIDPVSETVVGSIAAPPDCGPSGLVLGPHNQALSACAGPTGGGAAIYDLSNPHAAPIVVNGTTCADEVSYNAGNRTYDFPIAQSTRCTTESTCPACEVVIDADHPTSFTTVPLVSTGGEHSVASDPDDGNVAFVPAKDSTTTPPGPHDQGVVVVAESP